MLCGERNALFSPPIIFGGPGAAAAVRRGDRQQLPRVRVAPGGFNGKPTRAKADSHIAKASADTLPLPLPPDKWGGARVFTELVVRDESQDRRRCSAARLKRPSEAPCAVPWR